MNGAKNGKSATGFSKNVSHKKKNKPLPSKPKEQMPKRPAFSKLSDPITIYTGKFSYDSKDGKEEDANRPAMMIYLHLDKNGCPIKIGDGQFGVVFEARSPRNDPLAVKILHEERDTDGSRQKTDHSYWDTRLRWAKAKERFKFEAESLTKIRGFMADKGQKGDISYIVDHIGWTNNFPTQNFAKEFKKLGLNLSSYALVTDKYDGTLKDLLEEREEGQNSNGYDILAQLDFKTRIGTVLPFLQDIAEGMSIMHDARYCHLDVKPANIFWRRLGMTRFHAAIGDLGYIRESDVENFSATGAALGSLHYRSPEQKDFEDICEVDVLDGTTEEGENILETADPKFATTIVEQGDMLKFLKAKEWDFEVTKIERADGQKKRRTKIYIKNKDRENLTPDYRTQVVMYKRQGIRTDLFGFGAITYDLLTCGDSPERFYNYIIAFDREGEDVMPIISEYMQVATYQDEPGREPAYASIFGSFFDPHNSEYAPPEVVQIVLKTMLYKASGTYYAEHGNEAFKHIVDELKELGKNYTAVKDIEENHLITKSLDKDAHKKESKLFRELVESIQQLNLFSGGKSSFSRRICLATARFRQLLSLVVETCESFHELNDSRYEDKDFYFAELAPENILILKDSASRESLKLNFKERIKVKEYLGDMLKDRLGTVRFPPRYVSAFWPPEELGYLRRRIELRHAEGQENTSSVWQYRFLEASPLGDNVRVKDWIVGPDKELRQVTSVEGENCIRLGQPISLEVKKDTANLSSLQRGKNGDISRPKDEIGIRGILYRGINRGSYYLDVLGRYIYQLFFGCIADNGLSEPVSVQSVKLQLKASPTLTENLCKALWSEAEAKVFSEGARIEGLVTKIYRRLTAIYLLLAIPQLRKQFDPEDDNDMSGSGLRRLEELWHDLSIDIAKCLQLDRLYLTEPSKVLREVDFNKRMDQWENENSLNEDEMNLCFSAHIRDILTKQPDNYLEDITLEEATSSPSSNYNLQNLAKIIDKKRH